MMNPESEERESPHYNWSPLQIEICMSVALAKRDAFIAACYQVGDMARLGVITKAVAADVLNETALYNGLYFEYGRDDIQRLMSNALGAQETTQQYLRRVQNSEAA